MLFGFLLFLGKLFLEVEYSLFIRILTFLLMILIFNFLVGVDLFLLMFFELVVFFKIGFRFL